MSEVRYLEPKRASGVRRTAEQYDVSPRTVKRWIVDGLPVLQQGPRRKVLIRPEDVEAFLQRRQVSISKPALDVIVNQMVDEMLSGHARRQTPAAMASTKTAEVSDVR